MDSDGHDGSVVQAKRRSVGVMPVGKMAMNFGCQCQCDMDEPGPREFSRGLTQSFGIGEGGCRSRAVWACGLREVEP